MRLPRPPERHAAGLRTVAAFEAGKGLLVIVAGLGLLSFVGRDVEETAEQLVRHLHLNPARHYPHIFLDAAARISDRQLLALAAFALVYAGLRLAEAWGLWRRRALAQWLAALSGSIYLPFEVYELSRGITAVRVFTFAVNLGIVGYMAHVLVDTRRRR
jgi:uncharacterized membrane protein (DUF2068 family)